MKILFLDFDGVLNSYADPRFRVLYPDKGKRVQRIVQETGARIVVSSAWRHGRTVADLQALLQACCIDPTAVIDKTTEDEGGTWNPNTGWVTGSGGLTRPRQRGNLIMEWLDAHPDVTEYVVLDDNSDMDAVWEHFVQTSMDVGITDADATRAIEILNGHLQPPRSP